MKPGDLHHIINFMKNNAPAGERHPDSRQQSKASTLRLQLVKGQVFFVSLVLLFLLLILATTEALLRTETGKSIVGIPSIGTKETGFESRLNSLDEMAAGREAIDCVFLGDSTAMSDFMPSVFSASLREVSGIEIDCFNFGSGAFTLVDTAAQAQILIKDYSPRILIIGLEALAFTVATDEPGGVDFSEWPWTRYRLGQFTFEGWLYEHLAVYSHLNHIKQLVSLQTSPVELQRLTLEINNQFRDGFWPLTDPGPFDVSMPPDPKVDHPYHENYFGHLTEFKLLPEQLAALDQVVALNGSSTQVILVEIPVPPTFLYYFGNGAQDYDKFIAAIEKSVAGSSVPFWRTTELGEIPANYWFNYNHLNANGALIFSDWLGKQLGQAMGTGTVKIPGNPAQSN